MAEFPPLRLALDAHMVGERETGNETYTLNLVKSLLDLFPQHSYHVFATHREILERHIPPDVSPNILVGVPSDPFRRILFTLPNHVQKNRSQLLHVNYIAPPRTACPVVVTVHDITYLLYPKFFSLRDRLLLSALIPFTIRRAAAVIAVSQKTRADLIQRYGIPQHKITVTYEGADRRFRPLDKTEAKKFVRETYGVGQDFILALGNLQPRKNIPRLLQAYARLKKERGSDLSLVIVGQALWRESEVHRAVRDMALGKDVIFTGYVPDEHLPFLYNAAQFFVFPSLYEGFGLPPLEAMSCGIPVVCSSAGALPEVVGDAALVFDPRDTEGMFEKLALMASSPESRAIFGKRGLHRAQLFSWEVMARQTMEVYQEVIQRSKSDQ